jgi:hypothetical protein
MLFFILYVIGGIVLAALLAGLIAFTQSQFPELLDQTLIRLARYFIIVCTVIWVAICFYWLITGQRFSSGLPGRP